MTWSVIIQKDKISIKYRLWKAATNKCTSHSSCCTFHMNTGNKDKKARKEPSATPSCYHQELRKKRTRLRKFSQILLKDQLTKEGRLIVTDLKRVRKITCNLNSIFTKNTRGKKTTEECNITKSLQTQRSKFRPSPIKTSMLLRLCHIFNVS